MQIHFIGSLSVRTVLTQVFMNIFESFDQFYPYVRDLFHIIVIGHIIFKIKRIRLT